MSKGRVFLVFVVNLLLLPLLHADTRSDAEPEVDHRAQHSNHISVEVYIERARQMKLSEQPGWRNLLHYKITRTGELESQADDAAFYLAETGATDPGAELEADLRGFFSHRLKAHPQCLFPARMHWLNRQLNFKGQVPVVECKKFNRWKTKFQVKQLTLLFPTMYLDNPASMFGHTFIRFDREDGNQLLSQTLSYAAATGGSDDSILVYSWKGITGGYAGRFFITPYFETLQEYSDIEQRDIWEYTLNLNQQEIAQLARHMWELRGIHFEYYFFRENCAYRLLSLLDVAREGINTSMSSHPMYAIPVDTVRDIERAGLISSRHYRPSTQSKIVQMSEQMSEKDRELAFSVVDKKITPEVIPPEEVLKEEEYQLSDLHKAGSYNLKVSLSDTTSPETERKLKVLQLANEILNQKKKQGVDTDELQLSLLSARSKLPAGTQQQMFSFESQPPELAHQSARWQFSVGERDQQRFIEMGFRPAFHDILDAPQGFNNGASITVLDTRLRWYKEEEKLELERLDLFSMRSLVPVEPWVTPLSKRISFQVKRRELAPDQRITAFESQFALGYTANAKNLMAYAMLDAQLEYAPALKNNHALYLGADTGVLWVHRNKGFSSLISWRAEISYQNLQQISGEEGDIQTLNAGIQLDLLRNHAFRFEYEYTEYGLFDVTEAKASYLVYF